VKQNETRETKTSKTFPRQQLMFNICFEIFLIIRNQSMFSPLHQNHVEKKNGVLPVCVSDDVYMNAQESAISLFDTTKFSISFCSS